MDSALTQTLITAVLVAACAAYAVWQFLPRTLKQRAARACGRPQWAPAAGGCGGCDGCGTPKAGPAQARGEAVVHIVRRGSDRPTGR